MARTDWADFRVNDAHVHFFSHSFYSGLARQRQAESAEAVGPMLGLEIPGSDHSELAARWVAELDAAGVDRACLIASAPGDEASVAAAVAHSPERFYGYFMFDPTQPDATDRMKHAASNPHLHAVCLFPAMHRYAVTDQRVAAILEIAEAHHMAVFVHCGALSVGVRTKLGLPSLFDMRFSNPIDLHPVALHFPQIRFVIPHFGAGMFREALMLADLCPNVWLDTSSSNKWMHYEGLNLRNVFSRAIEVVGLNRLLFGSDSSFFPRGWNGEVLQAQAKALYELGLSETEAQHILADNLENFLAPRHATIAGTRTHA